MTISWDVQISDVNTSTFRADVTFTRTDSVSGETENYTFNDAIIETTAQRMALLDQVWSNHVSAAANKSAADEFIDNLEQLAKSNLESREA